MGLLDELKKQVDATEDLAKLKTAYDILGKRIAALEGTLAEAEEAPEEETAEEAPSEETEEAPAEETEEGQMEEESPEEEVEEPGEEPVVVAKPKIVQKPVAKPAKPKIAVGMKVYGPPSQVKNKSGEYKPGDEVAWLAKVESIDTKTGKAIINYIDKDRSKALGGNPPLKVRVNISALEPEA